MKKIKLISHSTCLVIVATAAIPNIANAGITYKDGDKYLKIGGRIQMQYYTADPDAGQKNR